MERDAEGWIRLGEVMKEIIRDLARGKSPVTSAPGADGTASQLNREPCRPRIHQDRRCQRFGGGAGSPADSGKEKATGVPRG